MSGDGRVLRCTVGPFIQSELKGSHLLLARRPRRPSLLTPLEVIPDLQGRRCTAAPNGTNCLTISLLIKECPAFVYILAGLVKDACRFLARFLLETRHVEGCVERLGVYTVIVMGSVIGFTVVCVIA